MSTIAGRTAIRTLARSGHGIGFLRTSTRDHLRRAAANAASLQSRRTFSRLGGLRQLLVEDRQQLQADIEAYKAQLRFPTRSHRVIDVNADEIGKVVRLHGYFEPAHVIHKNLVFSKFTDGAWDNSVINVVSEINEETMESVKEAHEKLQKMSPATPVCITAEVVPAPPKKEKKGKDSVEPQDGVKSGDRQEVELKLRGIMELNGVDSSLIITKDTNFPPEQRHLQLRYNKSLNAALFTRARVASIVRNHLDYRGFLEVETPLLFKSTPEGAREFLVPTRNPGHCYALPQSPQQYKQILMASGVPRYYQIAKCFRDEDLRADRQPEFTQLDLEMGFADDSHVMDVMSKLVQRIWREVVGFEVKRIPVMTYSDAIRLYGIDKPDLRFPDIKIKPLLPPAHPNHPEWVSEYLEFPTCGFSQQQFLDKVVEIQEYIELTEFSSKLEGIEGFNPRLTVDYAPSKKSVRFLASRPRMGKVPPGWKTDETVLGRLRRLLIREFGSRLPKKTEFAFTWITGFPLFTAEEGFVKACHHPFTAPVPEDLDKLLTDPQKVRGAHYDLVVNGVELGGGSVRIHNAALQREVFKMLNIKEEQFGHLLKVLESGAPPHAGMALGFDRLVAVLLGRESVRDVIAFPKTKGGDPLVGCPSVCKEELKEYGLEIAKARE